MATHRRRVPAWVAGLLLAVVLVLVVILVFAALGLGDDPVIEGLAAGPG